ncbi:MAG TPA: hypothetical protein VLD57_01600 [Blastocatellia bacterium]|nr:hypothetical protein [Blastocatellia bacterium]
MRKSLFVVLLISISLPFTAVAQRTSDTPVTTTIRDFLDVADPDTGSTERFFMHLQSDGEGVYRNSKSVRSVIINEGGWDMDTGYTYIKAPTRKGYIDFSQPVAGSAPGGADPVPPFIAGVVRPWYNSKCFYDGNRMLDMGEGETFNCGLTISFINPADGGNYRIIMWPACPGFPDNCANTNSTSVTCTGVDGSGKCNRWKIEPGGECVTADCAVRKNEVRLARVTTVKGKDTVTNLGHFYMTFSVEMTNP